MLRGPHVRHPWPTPYTLHHLRILYPTELLFVCYVTVHLVVCFAWLFLLWPFLSNVKWAAGLAIFELSFLNW